MIEGRAAREFQHRHIKVASYVAIVLLGCLHLAQVPLHTVAWVGRHWSESAIVLVERLFSHSSAIVILHEAGGR